MSVLRFNEVIHVVSLSATKLADGLIDPKLVLAWVLTTLGAPGALIGALVPIREAGALLPQMLLSRHVQASRRRKIWWSAGSAFQGAAALGIAVSIFAVPAATASYAIVAFLAVLALARAMCSVSYKDALARSVEKRERGKTTGAAGSIASVAVLGFGALLALGIVPLTLTSIGVAIAVASALWFFAAALFTRLDEQGDANSPSERGTFAALFEPLIADAQLRRFVLSRALLTVTALAPPFIIILSAGESESGLGTLGPFILASSLAAILSSYLWGWLSDRSSRQTLAAGGAVCALIFAGCAAIEQGTLGAYGGAAALFVAQIGYQGVRAGRSLHITDMTSDETRARYSALANTLIGIVLLCGAAFGVIADVFGLTTLFALFAVLAIIGSAVALTLNEVQQADAARSEA